MDDGRDKIWLRGNILGLQDQLPIQDQLYDWTMLDGMPLERLQRLYSRLHADRRIKHKSGAAYL